MALIGKKEKVKKEKVKKEKAPKEKKPKKVKAPKPKKERKPKTKKEKPSPEAEGEEGEEGGAAKKKPPLKLLLLLGALLVAVAAVVFVIIHLSQSKKEEGQPPAASASQEGEAPSQEEGEAREEAKEEASSGAGEPSEGKEEGDDASGQGDASGAESAAEEEPKKGVAGLLSAGAGAGGTVAVGNTSLEKAKERPWNLILLSRNHPLPEDFRVDLIELQPGQMADARLVPDARQMFEDAAKDGVVLEIASAFRSVGRQEENYNAKVAAYVAEGRSQRTAEAMAGRLIARPGHSEHHTGLALDIVTPGYRNLDEGFGKTRAAQWLAENAYKYGFILRYPEGKLGKTGYSYEPWHYRYVGHKAAQAIFEGGLTLEEYLGAAQ